MNKTYLYQIPVRRDQNPELFRQFMNWHWIYAGFSIGIGGALFIASMPREE